MATPDTRELANELRLAVLHLRRALRAQADSGDFTPTQASVLRRLDDDGPATISALAKAEGVRPQSMGATIAALEGMDALRREPDPNDGRQSIVALAPEFRAALHASRATRVDWLTTALEERLNASERAELARAIALLGRLTLERTS
jgi:DNA-binding MarR family transcriptional regulator